MAREDRTAIRECKYRYCYRLDATDADGFVALFADGATLDVSVYGTATGEAELREFVDWVGKTVVHSAHLVANPVVAVDGDAATGRWYYAVVLEYPDGTVEVGQGRYEDTFRRVDGEWRLASVRARRQVGVPID